MKPIELTTADFLTKVANIESDPKGWKYLGDKPALIDFYTSWCGYCKSLSPILNVLAEEYGDQIQIYKIDADKEEALYDFFKFRTVPYLIYAPMNGKPEMGSGVLSKAELKANIEKFLLQK